MGVGCSGGAEPKVMKGPIVSMRVILVALVVCAGLVVSACFG